ncbi:MAG TPA: C45 family peptidase [Candidatus Saccharimonadales bacterium]|nr:C45 family peptidase [Candidatus Saccharimonadales bacterium]
MKHVNYYELTAKDNYGLGLQRGELFGDVARRTLARKKHSKYWQKKIELSKDYLNETEKHFPLLVDELEGYAKASNISFQEFWTMSLEDDFDYLEAEKCTTVVTNNGKLISHNEDWEVGMQDVICILKKTLQNVTTFELFYYNTLGGASICVNSYGYVMTINTLTHTDRQIGVPRNVIARWLSETKNVEKDFEKLTTIKRSLGYNHIFANTKGMIWDLECSATQQKLLKPQVPYVHTNHFTASELKRFEENDGSTGTFERYDAACELVKPRMTVEEMTILNSNKSKDNKESIMNERTIGKMIIDLEKNIANVWLKREEEKGWIAYNLDFIK